MVLLEVVLQCIGLRNMTLIFRFERRLLAVTSTASFDAIDVTGVDIHFAIQLSCYAIQVV